MKLYRCVYQMGVETALEYRANMVLTLLSTIFPIIIQTFLWNYLYGNGDAGAMTGYSYTEIIVYTLLAGLVSKLVITGFEYQINEDIKDGGLNKYLIRPVNYCGYRFCSYLGEKMPPLILLLICTPVLVAFSSIFLGLKLSLVRIVLFLVGLVLAVILNFFIFYCVALLSFWLTDVHLLFGTVSVVLVVVSGGVFPMDIFGKTAALLISLLPFGYTTQFPVNIINGKLSMGAIGTGMLCQLVWIVFFWGLGQMMWKKGLQRFAAVGG